MDTAYLSTSYSYDDKDYFEQGVAVLPTPCGFQQPQHGHLYPIVPQPLSIQGGTQLAVDDDCAVTSNGARKRGTKRGRPTKNPVWTFFRRIDDKSVQCNMCARLVKSACATNMSKHLERHHQNSTISTGTATIDRADFAVQKYDQTLVGNYSTHQPSSWNPYVHQMQPLKVVTGYDHYQGITETQRSLPGVPWNPDRRGAKRNRRTKHPVWELFRRTTDGNAQCVLCSVVVRSPCSSNFMGHLNRHHSEHYQDIYSRWLEGRVEMPSLPS
ncbi:BED zinc finger [Oesophagostomum dentatum]|uniref:BED zinc finger n=1 Tax=Oesophagostomum dentatum TaxID=61180 RepID=A0A0B1TFH5_OESDE|nr:BED zinc finger [Oesophagostomum dentatum]